MHSSILGMAEQKVTALYISITSQTVVTILQVAYQIANAANSL